VRRRHFLGLAGATSVGAAGIGARWTYASPAGASMLEDRCYARTHRGHCDLHWSVDTDEKAIALTFDDGPNPRYTPAVLDLLERHGATATFFTIGTNVDRHPDLARRIAAAGHELANHTHAHPNVEDLSFDEVRREIAAGAASVEAVTGAPSRWFRPPRGMVTGAVVAAAAAEGHDVTMWSLTRGGPSVPDDDDRAVLASMVGDLHPGAVVVLHDGIGVGDDARPKLVTRRDAELRALDGFLAAGAEAGYRFTSFGRLLDERA
jgi:peptidoglycan-N-acetylglucosamine deacetylase